MNKLYLTILACILLFGCESKQAKKDNADTSKTPKKEAGMNRSKDTIAFLDDCKRLAERGYIGGLQGTTHSRDSTGLFGFIPCYDCAVTYEVVLVLKGNFHARKTFEYETLTREFDKGCENNFNKFNCFAFVVPLKDPEKQKDGHGIGLTSCKKIVEMLGGKIWLDSVLGQGTTIYFTLPTEKTNSRDAGIDEREYTYG